MSDFHRGRGRGHSLDFDNRQRVYRETRLQNNELHVGFEHHAGGFGSGSRRAIVEGLRRTFGIGAVVGRRRDGPDATIMSGSRQAIHDSVANDVGRWGGPPLRAFRILDRIRIRRGLARTLAHSFLTGNMRGHANRQRRVAAVTNTDVDSVRTAVHEVGHIMDMDHPPVIDHSQNIMQPTATGHQAFLSTPAQQQQARTFIRNRRGRGRSF